MRSKLSTLSESFQLGHLTEWKLNRFRNAQSASFQIDPNDLILGQGVDNHKLYLHQVLRLIKYITQFSI